ncbi:MAG: ABC transporter permease subunit [Firmicutes bacterium]|nr:ABC transporter permease subunit [Bacillota bacterium]
MEGTGDFLLMIPPLFFIIILSAIAWFLANKKVALFTVVSLFLIFGMGLWQSFVKTFVLVIVATLISLIVGIPIGVLISKRMKLDRIATPILDFMQTMPPFVYLIPAVMFFGIGDVPGVISTVVFSMPPAIRLTKLGLKQVPEELEEVGDSFGLTPFQMLYKIKLPLALPSIMAGINQTIMMSLSMVVVASMIGTKGLGSDVLNGIQRNDIGIGFEAGLSVVILAIILDRITSSLGTITQRKKA